MGQSGNPSKKGTTKKAVSSAADFKKKSGGVIELPSGLRMKLRNKGGLRLFMKQGIIPNSLMGVVNGALEGKKPKDEDLVNADGGVDEQMIADMMTLLDHLIVECSVEPKVHPVPEDEDDRDDDLLYADEVEDTDKMFVFQWVSGGTTDLESFRERYSQNVASLGGGQ